MLVYTKNICSTLYQFCVQTIFIYLFEYIDLKSVPLLFTVSDVFHLLFLQIHQCSVKHVSQDMLILKLELSQIHNSVNSQFQTFL